jgi:hypothetical protein
MHCRVLHRLPPTYGSGVGAGSGEDHLVFEAGRDVEQDSTEEGQADAQVRVPQGVNPLEDVGLVDGDVTIYCHQDDDVDRAGHEAIYDETLKVGLVEGGDVVATPEPVGDVKERGQGGDETA